MDNITSEFLPTAEAAFLYGLYTCFSNENDPGPVSDQNQYECFKQTSSYNINQFRDPCTSFSYRKKTNKHNTNTTYDLNTSIPERKGKRLELGEYCMEAVSQMNKLPSEDHQCQDIQKR